MTTPKNGTYCRKIIQIIVDRPGGRVPRLETCDFIAVPACGGSGTAKAVFDGKNPKGFPLDILKVARRKLRYLNAAMQLEYLKAPPGDRLEGLKGDRAGQHSVRINDKFRMCFKWTPEGPTEVEITDHH